MSMPMPTLVSRRPTTQGAARNRGVTWMLVPALGLAAW